MPGPSSSGVGPRPATGVWLFPAAAASELVDAVVAAERGGLDEVWIADEGVMREPAVVLAAAAVATERIRLGVGITSPVLRHPGAIAATMATLDELSGGRAMLGLGVGGELSLDPFGLRAERPVRLLREAIETARAVLARHDGPGYRVPAHASPARDVPVYVASRGEQINHLASRLADGVFVSGFPPERVDEVLGWARATRAVRVALYQSVRFRPGGDDDPTSIGGAPEVVARQLVDLVRRHDPDSIGLALVDGDAPGVMVERAVATMATLGAMLSSP